MKKKLRIDFTDFWPGFKKEDNFFYNILARYYEPEITEDPDILFCSYFSRKHFGYRDCVKVYYMGENLVPDFNLFDYVMGFHPISFEDRYLRLPHYALYPGDAESALHKHEKSDEYYLSRKKFCNRVVSNPEGAVEREALTEAIESIARIDSGGRYKNNVGGPVKDKLSFERDYRFSIAFENSSTPGYTTEKLLQAFAGETIPVYWGDPLVSQQFNPAAFIDCTALPVEEAVRRIREIWESDEKYLKMMKAPAVCETSLAAEFLKDDYADEFIRNIAEQGRDGFRRNRVYAGAKYENEQRAAAKYLTLRGMISRPLHYGRLRRVQRQSGTDK